MKLYSRDYSVLTESEQMERIRIRGEHTTHLGKLKVYDSTMYRNFPKAVRHFESLFPNNFLDIVDLGNFVDLHQKNKNYKELIDNTKTIETDIQKYIMNAESYHIIGSILKEYRFGHHGTYLFPEFQLGNSYEVDYLLAGDASGGYEFLLVELENPTGNITIGDGEFGAVIRKGMKQVNDWKIWIEENYSTFAETFEKATSKHLPKEFYKLDSSRIHYAIVAGKRKDFKEKTYILKRRLRREQDINLLHYENLYDFAEGIIGESTY